MHWPLLFFYLGRTCVTEAMYRSDVPTEGHGSPVFRALEPFISYDHNFVFRFLIDMKTSCHKDVMETPQPPRTIQIGLGELRIDGRNVGLTRRKSLNVYFNMFSVRLNFATGFWVREIGRYSNERQHLQDQHVRHASEHHDGH